MGAGERGWVEGKQSTMDFLGAQMTYRLIRGVQHFVCKFASSVKLADVAGLPFNLNSVSGRNDINQLIKSRQRQHMVSEGHTETCAFRLHKARITK